MGAVYTVPMVGATVAANGTLVILRTASSVTTRASAVEVLRATCSQNGTGTSQQLGVLVGLKASAFGTYTSTTPTLHYMGGNVSGITGGTAGAAGTAGTNASAEGAGGVTTLWQDGFNNLNGWLWVPTPEERLVVPVDTAVIIKLVGTPTTLTGWNAALTFRELN